MVFFSINYKLFFSHRPLTFSLKSKRTTWATETSETWAKSARRRPTPPRRTAASGPSPLTSRRSTAGPSSFTPPSTRPTFAPATAAWAWLCRPTPMATWSSSPTSARAARHRRCLASTSSTWMRTGTLSSGSCRKWKLNGADAREILATATTAAAN